MYYSRSESFGVRELVKEHLQAVGRLAGEFAFPWNGDLEAEIAGRMHDIGKYGDLFQKVLDGKESHVDHWTSGANIAASLYKKNGIAIALAILGHHTGLQQGNLQDLQSSLLLANDRLQGNSRQWAGNDTATLAQRWQQDAGFDMPASTSSNYIQNTSFTTAAMLDVRMLFSALVDADWLSAEAHENRDVNGPKYRVTGPSLTATNDIENLMSHVCHLREKTKAPELVRQVRDRLFNLCLDAGSRPQGLYTLAAPTGSGKTVSMLAYALRHCEINGLSRIIVVLPYLSILDQTIDTYRKILAQNSIRYIVEDDSLARDIGEAESGNRMLAENWDAPVIITTTVRFFESLFSNRPADCRKLHRIAKSVILFDEAQTMPLTLAVPTLATVAALVKGYGCSVVFSTATQPAFEDLSNEVCRHAGVGWEPKPIVPKSEGLFDKIRRVTVNYSEERRVWSELAVQLTQHPSALAIVNMKRHAATLYEELKKLGCEGAVHLSTSMCPAHRRDTLAAVRMALDSGIPCRLVATQCVEAGVDLDFPVLWRALAPLDSLCQAAGRCNREGRIHIGQMHVFIPEEEKKGRAYPDSSYERAAKLVYEMAHLNGFPDIFDPDVIHNYYSRLYARSQNLQEGPSNELLAAISRLDFPEVSRLYKWIGKSGVNILVPYNRCKALYNELTEQASRGFVNSAWFRRARQITVGAFINRDSAAFGWLVAVKKGREVVDGWYILVKQELYDGYTGLSLEKAQDDSNFIVDGR